MTTTTVRTARSAAGDVDAEAEAVGRALAGRSHPPLPSRAAAAVLDRAMANEALKTQLLRLVDVYPATSGPGDAFDHIVDHLSVPGVPRALRAALGVAGALPGGRLVAAAVARRSITSMASRFIIGSTDDEVVERVGALWRTGRTATVDLLGEKTVTDAEADRYASRVLAVTTALAASAASWPARAGEVGPRASVSVKPTALSPHLGPLTAKLGIDDVVRRLRPVLEVAADRGVLVWLDMEHYEVKDVTFELLERLAADPALARLELGVVVQAYLRSARDDLQRVLDASAGRPVPLWVRLVKGAYWDAETIHARAEGWVVPVWSAKADTDCNYEALTRTLHDHHGAVQAAFASHNLRSLGHAVAYARSLGIADTAYEVQMLHGMAPETHDAAVELGLRLRVYAPMGELVPGMGYLVRRLLENTANDGFVRMRSVGHAELATLLTPPTPVHWQRPPEPARPAPGRYAHEPALELRRPEGRRRFGDALSVAAGGATIDVPLVIGGERSTTHAAIDSVNPAHPDRVVARSASADAADADAAVAAAERAFGAWSARTAAERAGVLRATAAVLRRRRPELGALAVLEAGKPWAEADADVGEAIDFCEYYAEAAVALERGHVLDCPPGERNWLGYRARGVTAVISPWNFPLAIPTGMVVAALVTGNTVVLKPAEQTPAMALALHDALVEAGLPPGALNLVPGLGEVVGARLVEHPAVGVVAFTGSRQVGLSIVAGAAAWRPGQRSVKRVIAEMGGKNPIIVDTDADLDQAVPGTISSAFGFAGQKCSACSRVIAVGGVADALAERLAGATQQLVVGDPARPETEVGPLIDVDARDKAAHFAGLVPDGATLLVRRGDVPDEGFYVGPTLIDRVAPGAPVATEEVFGPVLAIIRVDDLDEAVAVANATDYALTAGLYSRSPTHIRSVAQRLRAGNVYVNRPITGAIPGRHPFGGYGLSGVGAKAGGPDYLLQFVDPWSVSENTMRQGFAPDDAEVP